MGNHFCTRAQEDETVVPKSNQNNSNKPVPTPRNLQSSYKLESRTAGEPDSKP